MWTATTVQARTPRKPSSSVMRPLGSRELKGIAPFNRSRDVYAIIGMSVLQSRFAE